MAAAAQVPQDGQLIAAFTSPVDGSTFGGLVTTGGGSGVLVDVPPAETGMYLTYLDQSMSP